jgi:hypothetical protein
MNFTSIYTWDAKSIHSSMTSHRACGRKFHAPTCSKMLLLHPRVAWGGRMPSEELDSTWERLTPRDKKILWICGNFQEKWSSYHVLRGRRYLLDTNRFHHFKDVKYSCGDFWKFFLPWFIVFTTTWRRRWMSIHVPLPYSGYFPHEVIFYDMSSWGNWLRATYTYMYRSYPSGTQFTRLFCISIRNTLVYNQLSSCLTLINTTNCHFPHDHNHKFHRSCLLQFPRSTVVSKIFGWGGIAQSNKNKLINGSSQS